jgi:hypothetical protein
MDYLVSEYPRIIADLWGKITILFPTQPFWHGYGEESIVPGLESAFPTVYFKSP